MHWNHRVFRQKYEDETVIYSIRTAYYGEDGSLVSYSKEADSIYTENYEDLRYILSLMEVALEKDIIEIPPSEGNSPTP